MIKLPVKRNILGIEMSDTTYDDVLEYVASLSPKQSQKTIIVTPNPEMVVYAAKHSTFKELINKADIAVCDGSGLLIASYILNKPLSARVTGVDLMVRLCSLASDQTMSIGLLGGRNGVAEKTAQCLRESFPNLKISYIQEEWTSSQKLSVDILFVAFGFPKQEEWIADHLPKIDVKVAMGVGGAFDYISGHVTRAPFITRYIGLEWLYRLIKEPWRWRRQIALIEFIGLVIKARISPPK